MEFIIENDKLIEIKNPEQDVHIPEGVTSLDHDVFNSLKEAKNVWFPASLINCHGKRVLLFRDQENVFVHQDNPMFSSYDGVLYNKDLTVLLCCPMKKRGAHRLASTTKSIADDAFCCSNLEEVELNDRLEFIGMYAFSDCDYLGRILIPESVKHIDNEAFVGLMGNSHPIMVIRNSYAHYYAKKNGLDYLIKPNNNEIVWSEHEWCSEYENAKFRKDYDKIRSLRQDVFRSTLMAVQKGEYMTVHGHVIKLPLTQDIQSRTKFYYKEIHPIPLYSTRYDTQIAAVNDDCLSFARRVHKVEDSVCVLNMASRRNPGGGVLSGAGAQEEYLFRCSDYYRSLYQYASYASDYDIIKSPFSYPLDRNFGGCFSSKVTVFRGTEEEGYRFLHHPWHMNFIAVPGMNKPETTLVNKEERIANHLVAGVKNKIRTLFRIALDNGQKTLILGALGCGAFKNPPKHIAELFKEILNEQEFKNVFRRVFFVIKEDHNSRGKGNFKPFKEVFGSIGNKEPLIPEPQLMLTGITPDIRYGDYRNENDPNDGRILHQERFGNGLIWSLYSNGTLEISGYGRMPDYINHWDSYYGEGQAPWTGCDKYGVMPYKLRICEGITYIGSNAFERFGCLKEIILPQSLLSIGKEAFFDCFHVEKINVPNHMSIEEFGVAELPLYYNNNYIQIEDMLLMK